MLFEDYLRSWFSEILVRIAWLGGIALKYTYRKKIRSTVAQRHTRGIVITVESTSSILPPEFKVVDGAVWEC